MTKPLSRAALRRLVIARAYGCCEYCLSHYIAIFFLAISRFTLLLPGWRGFLIALFSLVWIGNFYMGLYGRLRLDIKSTKIDVKKEEHALNELREESEPEIHQVR